MLINDVCLCGHKKFVHHNESCAVCKELWLEVDVVYHKYRADNLFYLECAYNQKKGEKI